jgi:hypothetical protein
MRLSRYFHALRDGYFSELDDLRQDSEGRDVLKARLRDKRDAFPTLAAMLDIDPLIAAPALHGAFSLGERRIQAIEALLGSEPDEFPSWAEVGAQLDIAPWAAPMIEAALEQEQGEAFLCTVVGLEYVLARDRGEPGMEAAAGRDDDAGDRDDDERDEGERDEGQDDEALGEDFLEQQGFDRRTGE